MFTRIDYLKSNDPDKHSLYYGEIIEEMGGAVGIWTPFSNDQVLAALESGDSHLNTLPLHKWDTFAAQLLGADKALRERGDYLTLAGGVCILKEAARLKVA